MKYRRFFLILTVVVSFFLFAAGAGVLAFIHDLSGENSHGSAEGGDSNEFTDMLVSLFDSQKPVNFLLLVGDRWSGCTDTILLINVNPAVGTVNIMSIPRDTKVTINGKNTHKINALYSMKNGKELVVNAVSEMLDVKIKYYVHFDIDTIKEVVNALGGVEYDVPVDMVYNDPVQKLFINLKKGRQTLDGDGVEQLLRFRHPDGDPKTWPKEVLKIYNNGDLSRIEVQQNFLKEFIRQKCNLRYVPKIKEVTRIIFDHLDTNLDINEVMKFTNLIGSFSQDKLNMLTLPVKHQTIQGQSYVVCQEDEAQEIVKQYFAQSAAPVKNIASGNGENTDRKTGNNSKSTEQNKGSGAKATPPKKTPTPKPDVTRENPSNDQSSVKGPVSPAP